MWASIDKSQHSPEHCSVVSYQIFFLKLSEILRQQIFYLKRLKPHKIDFSIHSPWYIHPAIFTPKDVYLISLNVLQELRRSKRISLRVPPPSLIIVSPFIFRRRSFLARMQLGNSIRTRRFRLIPYNENQHNRSSRIVNREYKGRLCNVLLLLWPKNVRRNSQGSNYFAILKLYFSIKVIKFFCCWNWNYIGVSIRNCKFNQGILYTVTWSYK